MGNTEECRTEILQRYELVCAQADETIDLLELAFGWSRALVAKIGTMPSGGERMAAVEAAARKASSAT